MKLAYKLRFLPTLAGVAMMFYFFIHWVGVSLPYQDPTSELLAEQAAALKKAVLMIFISAT